MENIKTTTTKLPENYYLYDADNRFPDLAQALEVHHANLKTLRELKEKLGYAVNRISDHAYAVRILDNLHDDFCYGSDGTTKKVVKFMRKYCGIYDAGECVPYELEKSLDVLRDAQKKNFREIISLEDQIKIDLLEEYQWAKGEELEQVADELRANGFTLEEEMYVRGKNNASDYGRAKAYSIQAGNKFFDWAKLQLPKMEADTVEQKQAAMVILQDKYLEAHNLKNVSADFLEPMFQKMRAATDKIINGAKRNKAIQFRQQRSKEHLQILSASYNTESGQQALNNFILQKTREVDVNGQSLSTSQAKADVFKAFYNIDHFPSDAEVFKLFNETKLLNQNNTWGKANPELLRDLMHQRQVQKQNRNSVLKAVTDAKKQ